ncbi:hypothetical protein [Bacillus testis]|uniref:hypothetical protein n=1 Tax=Bacillus testis TaxID=1622072 RepID=UPI00067F0922|nr:hypothetical protein [Bacillus testis]
MRLKTFVYILLFAAFIVASLFLYDKQFGAVSFFTISFFFFYLAYREHRKEKKPLSGKKRRKG